MTNCLMRVVTKTNKTGKTKNQRKDKNNQSKHQLSFMPHCNLVTLEWSTRKFALFV